MLVTPIGRLRLALLVLLFVAAPARAHPGPGLVIDSKGQIYFVHGVRHRIMKVDLAGKMSIFVQGEDGKKLSVPHHLVIDEQDNLYSVGDRDGIIWKIAPDASTTQVYPPSDWYGISFFGLGGDPFTRDAQGNLYGINARFSQYAQILKIGPGGRISALAGGNVGTADGKGSEAQFGLLHSSSFAWHPNGDLYLTDHGTYIRKITAGGTVTTLTDRKGMKLHFKDAHGLSFDSQRNLYVADTGNHRIQKVTPDGTASTLAGSGKRGVLDGPARTATFEEPTGVAVSLDGTVYVLDYVRDDPRLRKISPKGDVSTIAVVQ